MTCAYSIKFVGYLSHIVLNYRLLLTTLDSLYKFAQYISYKCQEVVLTRTDITNL